MKRMVLIAGAAMAAQAMTANVFAADAAKSATPATASASADAAAQAAAKTEEARKQLAEMRVQMQELSRKMADTALCHLEALAPRPMLTTLERFPEEYRAHAERGVCLAGACNVDGVSPLVEPLPSIGPTAS